MLSSSSWLEVVLHPIEEDRELALSEASETEE